jgi:hypothetical protein
MYAKMPFGLKNAGATFQRAMDITFANEKDVFLVIYLDDLTIFSQIDEDHLHHLRIVFQRCRKFGISLESKEEFVFHGRREVTWAYHIKRMASA